MDNLRIWGVNWIDGMLVTSKHFSQQQDFAIDLGRFGVLALSPGYGIVRSASDQAEPLEVSLRREGDRVCVSVIHCTALLPDGTFVNINSQFTSHQAVELEFDLSENSGNRLPVYLYLSQADKLEFGEPLEGEELSRAPWISARPILTLGPSSSLPAAAGMQIAELIRKDEDLLLNSDYVPPVLTSACGTAVIERMERLRNSLGKIEKQAQAALAEARQKTKADLSPLQEDAVRGSFLQSENLLHQIAYSYNRIFDKVSGISCRELIDLFSGLVRGFGQSFLIYPELREHVRTGSLTGPWGSQPGGALLPELMAYQERDFALSEMTQFFDETERALTVVGAILNFYAAAPGPARGEAISLDGNIFEPQQHGNVRYSYRDGHHHVVIDDIDPRGTKDVVVKFNKRLLPQASATGAIIYIGANEIDDIAKATVARKPVQYTADPDYWLLRPNEYFPLESSRLVRLNIIIDGDLDTAALEVVAMEDVGIFSRSR